MRSFLFLFFSCLPIFCIFSTFLLASSEGFAKIIQAEIEHKDYLPEVPPRFRRGAILESEGITKRVEWFPVPDWMAGTFMKDGDMETFEKNFQTGSENNKQFWMKNRVTLTFGHQRDALNTVWHAEVVPFRADGARSGARDERYVLSMNCLKSTPESVVLKFHSVVVSVNGEGRILGSKQQEEIVSFFAGDSRFINTTSSTKTFSDKGQPLYRLDSNTKRLKTEPFKREDVLSGINLPKSLSDFLIAKNMTDRVAQSGAIENGY